jgi:hypothetical protein
LLTIVGRGQSLRGFFDLLEGLPMQGTPNPYDTTAEGMFFEYVVT